MMKVKLSEVALGSLFKTASSGIYRKVRLDVNVYSKSEGYFATVWPDNKRVVWYSRTDDVVELLDDEGKEIPNNVRFDRLAVGEKFKIISDGDTWAKSSTANYAISGIRVALFRDDQTVVRA